MATYEQIRPVPSEAAPQHKRRQRVFRHSSIVRLWHWVNAACVFVLLFSGLQIFNAHPSLYWGNDARLERQVMSIGSERSSTGELTGYLRLGTHRLLTTGFLGVSTDSRGQTRSQAIPNWLVIPSGRQLALGRRWHLAFAWFFCLNLVFYLGYRAQTIVTTSVAKYRPLQQAAYSLVLWGLLPAAIVTGLTMSPWLDAQWPALPALFGGRQSARTLHFMLAMLLGAFSVGHVLMVMKTGFFRNLHSMISGWYYLR